MAGKIKGITIELDGETKGLDKALSSVNKKSKDLQSELKQVERALKFNPGNADLIAQKQKLLAEQVENTSEKLKQLKSAQAEVERQFESGEIGEEQYRAFQRELIETESRLNHFEGQLEQSQSKLEQFGERIGETGEKFKAAGEKLTSAGKSMSTKITAPLTAAAAIATKVGSDFEAGMSKVGAISGATGDDLASLTEKARKMGATTQFSATESADALSYMAMAGWKTDDMLNGIDGIMSLAAASGEDLASTSDIVTDALTAFGMSAADSGKFADVLAAASSNANTNVSMLGESFKHVAPVAGALGMSAEDASIALGLMANAGIKGSSAGTSLRTMLTNLSKPTAAMDKAMDKLGISLTDNKGNMKSLDEVMMNLRESFKGLSEAEQAKYAATIFGKEAMSGSLAVINASADDYDSLKESIYNSEGAAKKMADTMNDNLQGRLKEMKSALEDVAITVYDNLKPALESLVGIIKSIAEWFQNLSPTMQTTIMIIAAIAAAIGPLLIVFGLLASSIGSIMTLFSTLTPFLSAAGAAIGAISTPVLIVIGAIAALIAIGVLLWKNWDTIKAVAAVTWEAIKSITVTVFTAIGNFFKMIWNGIKTAFTTTLEAIKITASTAWNWIKNTTSTVFNAIADFFKSIWNGIKSFFTTIVTAIIDFVKERWNNLKTNTMTVFNAIKNSLKSIWNGIKSVFNTVIKWIVDFVKSRWENMKTNTMTIFNTIKSVLSTIWNGIKITISTVVNGIKSTISNVWNGIKSVTSSVFNGIKSFFDTIFSKIGSAAESFGKAFNNVWDSIKGGALAIVSPIAGAMNAMINGIESAVNAVARAINGLPSFDIPDWVPGVGGGKFGIPNIPTISLPRVPSLDVGTNYVKKDGLAMIHEGEAVVPKKYNPAAGGSGEGITQNITINSPEPTSPSETARKMKQASRALAMEW